MNEKAKRDLRIAEKWTPEAIRVCPNKTGLLADQWHRSDDPVKSSWMGVQYRFWPNLSDANNVDVIVEAEGIGTNRPYKNEWQAWMEGKDRTAIGPTRQAAILALLDPGEDGKT